MLSSPYLPAIVCLLGITGLSVMPNPQLPKFDLIATDKLGHAVAYGVLTFFTLRGMYKAGGKRNNEKWVIGGCFGWGVLMEFIQYSLVPSRFYEIDDMLANGIGVFAAWGIFKWIFKK